MILSGTMHPTNLIIRCFSTQRPPEVRGYADKSLHLCKAFLIKQFGKSDIVTKSFL